MGEPNKSIISPYY